jgi:hypothetical protein
MNKEELKKYHADWYQKNKARIQAKNTKYMRIYRRSKKLGVKHVKTVKAEFTIPVAPLQVPIKTEVNLP